MAPKMFAPETPRARQAKRYIITFHATAFRVRDRRGSIGRAVIAVEFTARLCDSGGDPVCDPIKFRRKPMVRSDALAVAVAARTSRADGGRERIKDRLK
jgi:hypothetical protein